MGRDSVTLGVVCALMSMVFFSTMDAVVKWLGADYPVHQIMFFRCTLAFVPVLLILFMTGGVAQLKTRRPGLHALRSVVGVISMGGAFYGFTTLPLADASAVFYTAPLLAVAFSVPILRERVGVRRWTAVLLGLVGALIVARPGGAVFNAGGLAMMTAAITVGLSSNIIRKLNQTDPAITITFYFTLTGAVVTAALSLVFGWVAPNTVDLMLLMGVGLLGGSAQYFLTLSFRYAAIGVIAPFKYLSIIIGAVIGYLVWSEVPDGLTLVGMAVIIATGLYSIYRETRAARMAASRVQNPNLGSRFLR